MEAELREWVFKVLLQADAEVVWAVLEMRLKEAYAKGTKEGLRRYAWWKDGCEYVGTCGTTLKQALKDVDDGKQ